MMQRANAFIEMEEEESVKMITENHTQTAIDLGILVKLGFGLSIITIMFVNPWSQWSQHKSKLVINHKGH